MLDRNLLPTRLRVLGKHDYFTDCAPEVGDIIVRAPRPHTYPYVYKYPQANRFTSWIVHEYFWRRSGGLTRRAALLFGVACLRYGGVFSSSLEPTGAPFSGPLVRCPSTAASVSRANKANGIPGRVVQEQILFPPLQVYRKEKRRLVCCTRRTEGQRRRRSKAQIPNTYSHSDRYRGSAEAQQVMKGVIVLIKRGPHIADFGVSFR